jgi:hypothetical protein
MTEPDLRAYIEQAVTYLKSEGRLVSNDKPVQSEGKWLADIQRMVLARWKLVEIRSQYEGDLGRFVQDVVTVYDKFVPELTKLLSSYSQSRDCGLYRSAQYMINTIRGLRRYLDPEDALQQTWLAIMGDGLKILGFKEGASLKTWVQAVLRNEILQVARKHRLIVHAGTEQASESAGDDNHGDDL